MLMNALMASGTTPTLRIKLIKVSDRDVSNAIADVHMVSVAGIRLAIFVSRNIRMTMGFVRMRAHPTSTTTTPQFGESQKPHTNLASKTAHSTPTIIKCPA